MASRVHSLRLALLSNLLYNQHYRLAEFSSNNLLNKINQKDNQSQLTARSVGAAEVWDLK